MWIRLGVVLALPLLVSGCGDKGGSADGRGRTVPHLDRTSWVATSVTEGGRPRSLVAGTTLRVDFGDGTININAGCNGLGGSYDLGADGALTAGPLASTEMGCDPPLMEQDRWLAETVFGSPLAASVEADTLTLKRGDLELVLTDRLVALPDAALQGTSWRLDGIRTGATVSSVPAGVTATLQLGKDGSVTAYDGCNGGGGTAEIAGSRITFGDLTWTLKGCIDDARHEVSAAVQAVLQGPVTWSVTEQALTLSKGDHGLVYRVAP